MRKLLLTLFAAILGLAVGAAAASPAAAGGWAVVSYDTLPPLVSGETATVTFRVLQHGITPVDIEDWGATSLRLRVTGPDGPVDVAANPTGVAGQFAASFTVPAGAEAGVQVVWENGLVLQEAAIAVPLADSDGASSWPGWAPAGFAGLAVIGTALVASDVVGRRRDRTSTDTGVTTTDPVPA